MAVEFYRAMAHVDDTSYILSDEPRIVRVNAAWTRFTEENDGREMLTHQGRGSNVLDAISGGPEISCTCRMIGIPIDGRFLVVTHAVRLEGEPGR